MILNSWPVVIIAERRCLRPPDHEGAFWEKPRALGDGDMQSDSRASTVRDTRDQVSYLRQYISSGAQEPALLLERPGMKLWSDPNPRLGSALGWRALLCSWLRGCPRLVLSSPVALNKQVS